MTTYHFTALAIVDITLDAHSEQDAREALRVESLTLDRLMSLRQECRVEVEVDPATARWVEAAPSNVTDKS